LSCSFFGKHLPESEGFITSSCDNSLSIWWL